MLVESFQHKNQHFVPGHAAQLDTCLAEDTCLIADPGTAISILTRSYIFVEIDPKIFLRPFSSLPLIQKGLLSITSESVCMKHRITT